MSDELQFSKAIRTIFLTGVGAVATGAEKSKALIDSLVEKGELTVEQGKILNQELKHKIDATAESVKTKAKEAVSKKGESAPEGTDFSEMLNKLTPEQLAALKEQLAAKEETKEEPGEEKKEEQE